MIDKYLIPFIGSKGVWNIQSPFQTEKGAFYTCKGVRKISDYIASNEDVLALVYKPKGLGEDEYNQDLAEDMVIIALQTDGGYWHYFPTKYLISYPDPNGVPYKKMGIYISLPPMPAARDLTFLYPEIQDLMLTRLGVPSNVKLTENSQITMVPEEKHVATDIARTAKVSSTVTQYARINELETANQMLIKKVHELEQYILAKHKPESYYTFMKKKDLGALLTDMANKQDFRYNVAVPGMSAGMHRQGSIAP